MRKDPRHEANRREDELLAELEAVYRAAGEAFAGWTCPASTECCRFGVTGREPYVTSIELAAVRRAVAARGGMRAVKASSSGSAPAQAAPLRDRVARRELPTLEAERACPMLTDAGRCAIYASRPLGCRTFFCDRAAVGTPVRHREVNALVRRIQDIAARHEPDGDRGRPLTRALEGPRGGDGKAGPARARRAR